MSVFSFGLRIGRWVGFLAPVAGLLVFWVLPFKAAVTVYAVIAGLAMVLQSLVEEAHTRRLIEEIKRREVHAYYAR